MTALEYFRLLAPEFAAVSDATANVWLNLALNFVKIDCLDAERRAMAHALYAAHLLGTTTQRSAGGGGSIAQGPLIKEKEGDLERSYGFAKDGKTYSGVLSYLDQYNVLADECLLVTGGGGINIMTRVTPWY